MRIGSLTSLSFQSYDVSSQRDVVQKHVPNYLQVQNYDMASENTTVSVKGTLVGSSNSNLALQIQELTSMYREKRVIWIDASDEYANALDFCRIIELSGPTIDSSKGPLIATFSIKAQVLLPWGTTHANPFNETGIVFRDLSGTVLGNALNPLDANCNFTSSNPGGSMAGGWFSWEFIADNQNPFTNVTSLLEAECNALTEPTPSNSNGNQAPVAQTGHGNTAFSSQSIDTGVFPNSGYSASLKANIISPAANSIYNQGYNFGSSGIDLAGYDRIRIWVRCDQAGQGAYAIQVWDNAGNYRQWAFNLLAANTWQQVEIQIESYTDQGASSPNFAAIQYINAWVETGTAVPSEITLWICDIRAEYGYITHCEDTSSLGTTNGSSLAWSNDTIVYKNSYFGIGAAQFPSTASAEASVLSSLRLSGTSGSAGYFGGCYFVPAVNWNLTPYDFLVVWVKADFGGNTTGEIYFNIVSSSGNYFSYAYSNLNGNQWYRLVIPLRNPSSTTGMPNLNSVQYIEWDSIGGASLPSNFWISEMALDIGQVVNCEFHLPDQVSQSEGANAIQVSSWDPNNSSYNLQASSDIFGNATGGTAYFLLSGNQSSAIWSSWWQGSQLGAIGSTIDLAEQAFSGLSTFTTTYGCEYRFVFSFKLSPATSDSIAGNYPSEDISGFQSFNKVRLKILVYVSNEFTSYAGF